MTTLLTVIIGLAAALWDSRTMKVKRKRNGAPTKGEINHLIHGGVRIASTCIVLFFTDTPWWQWIGYLALMDLVFTLCLNFFMEWEWDHRGETSWIDRILHSILRDPGQAVIAIEFLLTIGLVVIPWMI